MVGINLIQRLSGGTGGVLVAAGPVFYVLHGKHR